MQMKKLKLPWSFFAAAFILSITACAPVKPADPAYRWASGKWEGESGYGNPVEASFRVKNGNELTGFVTYHSASGRIDEGTIRSGMVGKNNDPNIIQGQIYWEGSGVTTNFRLDHTGQGLNGALSQPGELPFGRGAALKKAK